MLLEMLDDSKLSAESPEFDELVDHLNQWADVALRTLVWCKRDLPDYSGWHAKYKVAVQSPEEVTKMKLGKPNKIHDLQAEVECELTLQGATAIEDQLQA